MTWLAGIRVSAIVIMYSLAVKGWLLLLRLLLISLWHIYVEVVLELLESVGCCG